MNQRRFFLLNEPLLATEIESFLCRVTSSKSSPSEDFAPFSLLQVPSYNSNNIIPSILPEPTSCTGVTEFVSSTQEQGISFQLSALLGLNITRNTEQNRDLESRMVKKYSLPNPERYFQELMKNEHYARDVGLLLRKLWPRHAYLVTGFLTATESTWRIEEGRSKSTGFNIALPVSAALPVPVPGLVDMEIHPQASTSAECRRELHVAGEEIFAASYSIVKLAPKFTSSAGLVTSVPIIGRPKRAKAHHLAFGSNDDEEEEVEYESDDNDNDEDTINTSKSGGNTLLHDNITIVDIEDEGELNATGVDVYVNYG